MGQYMDIVGEMGVRVKTSENNSTPGRSFS